jgi:hypothetical protein
MGLIGVVDLVQGIRSSRSAGLGFHPAQSAIRPAGSRCLDVSVSLCRIHVDGSAVSKGGETIRSKPLPSLLAFSYAAEY